MRERGCLRAAVAHLLGEARDASGVLSFGAELVAGDEPVGAVSGAGCQFADATFPLKIEGTWGCQHKTTPNPGGGLPAAEYLFTLEGESKYIKEHVIPPEGQPVPPQQPTMPKPCAGVPKNPLCT